MKDPVAITKTRAIRPAAQRGAAGRWPSGSPSPDPAGRPSIPVHVKEAARAHTLTAIETLAWVNGGRECIARGSGRGRVRNIGPGLGQAGIPCRG
jgi:hypothetical protein